LPQDCLPIELTIEGGPGSAGPGKLRLTRWVTLKIRSGRALINGVEFSSSYHTVAATVDDDGNYHTDVKKTRAGRYPWLDYIEYCIYKIPILRGIYDLIGTGYMLVILLIISVLPFLLAKIETYLLRVAGSTSTYNILNIIMFVIILGISAKVVWDLAKFIKDMLLKSKSLFSYHGAEHKAAETYDAGKELSLQNVKKSSRISAHCGSNLAIFFVVIYSLSLLFYHINLTINFLLGWSIAYELFRIDGGEQKPGISLFYKISFYLQDHILTREPTDQQIEVAILAIITLADMETDSSLRPELFK